METSSILTAIFCSIAAALAGFLCRRWCWTTCCGMHVTCTMLRESQGTWLTACLDCVRSFFKVQVRASLVPVSVCTGLSYVWHFSGALLRRVWLTQANQDVCKCTQSCAYARRFTQTLACTSTQIHTSLLIYLHRIMACPTEDTFSGARSITCHVHRSRQSQSWCPGSCLRHPQPPPSLATASEETKRARPRRKATFSVLCI